MSSADIVSKLWNHCKVCRIGKSLFFINTEITMISALYGEELIVCENRRKSAVKSLDGFFCSVLSTRNSVLNC